jgi:hypothetical protein
MSVQVHENFWLPAKPPDDLTSAGNVTVSLVVAEQQASHANNSSKPDGEAAYRRSAAT